VLEPKNRILPPTLGRSILFNFEQVYWDIILLTLSADSEIAARQLFLNKLVYGLLSSVNDRDEINTGMQ
jgi:hypothetical protein